MAGPQGPEKSGIEDDHSGGEEGPKLDLAIQSIIGEALRDYCNDIIHQPVPAKFVDLLQRLEREDGQKRPVR